MERKTIGLSGLGSIARQHLAAFTSIHGVEVIGFDPTAELREAAVRAGAVRAVSTFDDLLASSPDALVIAAPDFAHLEQLESALRQGVPTLVEKPLGDTFVAARTALPALEATGTSALVGYVLRHRRDLGRARDLLLDGAIGRPVSFQVMLGAYGTITAAASRFAVPEQNRLYRDYSHEWDYLRWIFGPIVQVMGVARTIEGLPHVESPNALDALLLTEGDVAGAVHIDYVEPRGTRTLHVVGTGGTLHLDVGRGEVVLRRKDADHDARYDFGEAPAVPLRRQAEHLLALVDGADQPRVTLRDGLAAMAVTDALIRSAAGRTWEAVEVC